MSEHIRIFQNFVRAAINALSPAKGIIIDTMYGDGFGFLAFNGEIDGASARIQQITNSTLQEKVDQVQLDKVTHITGHNDIVFRFSPFGLKRPRYASQNSEEEKVPPPYQEIWDSLTSVSDEGFYFFLTLPGFFTSSTGRSLHQKLRKKGFYIAGMFEFPSGILGNTSISPIFVVLERENNHKVMFISEVNVQSNFDVLLGNFKEKTDSGSIFEGTFVDQDSFTSISNFKTVQQIKNLKTQYHTYKQYSLKEVAHDVGLTKDKFLESPENSIYIPKVGNSNPVSNLAIAKLKPQNYFQVILKSELVSSKYLEIFFRSSMGKLALESLVKGVVSNYRAKSDLLQLTLPIPDLKTQQLLISTHERLEKLLASIALFESELSLNPGSAASIQDSLDKTLESMGRLSEEDRLLALIRGGESLTLEFKATFTKDIERGTKEREQGIRTAALKTIVAFLNTEGGTLLVGVKDDGSIVGIEDDYYISDDKYLLSFKDQLKSRIGENCFSYLKYEIFNVKSVKILEVSCLPTSEAFFLDKKEYYVRRNPSVEKLEGEDLLRHIEHRKLKE